MRATEFYKQDLLENSFPELWRTVEVIKYGRAIDSDFYPVSKKGNEVHVNVMHAANLLYALALKASKANISDVLKNRLQLRSQDGKYFINDLAEALRSPENFISQSDLPEYKSIEEIRISLDRPFVEVNGAQRKVYTAGDFGNLKPLPIERFAIISQELLKKYSSLTLDTGLQQFIGELSKERSEEISKTQKSIRNYTPIK